MLKCYCSKLYKRFTAYIYVPLKCHTFLTIPFELNDAVIVAALRICFPSSVWLRLTLVVVIFFCHFMGRFVPAEMSDLRLLYTEK